MTKRTNTTSVLGRELKKRLAQLGMTQRELSRRTGVGRTTITNIITKPHWGFSEETFASIDMGLKWQAGTARRFHEEGDSVQPFGDKTIEERIDEYLLAILERLREMDIDQLEREVFLMTDERGASDHSNVASSKLIERQISRLVDALLANRNGTNNHRGAAQ